jgi:hypothetical protein
MKKILSATALFLLMMSCANSGDNGGSTDTTGTTNPSAIDTTQHPNGMTNGSVISTDTAHMNVDNTGNVNGGDSSNPR